MSDKNNGPKPSVKGKVYIQKPSKIQSLYNLFFSASPSEVLKGLIKYVLIPDAQYTINHMWNKAGDMMSYGVDEGNLKNNRMTEYHNAGKRTRNQANNQLFQNEDSIEGMMNRADVWKFIELEYRADCENVIREVKNYMSEGYDYLTVADLLSAMSNNGGRNNSKINIVPLQIHYEWGWPKESLTLSNSEYYEITKNGKYKMRMPKMTRI